jgi:hypothetical protein
MIDLTRILSPVTHVLNYKARGLLQAYSKVVSATNTFHNY